MCLLSQTKRSATLENLAIFLELIKNCAAEQGLSHKRIMQIEMAAEEVLVNIFNYAYQEEGGDVQVTCRLDDDGHFLIEFEDTGIPFDVLSLDKPDVSASISERKIGGLGVFLVRELMDDVQYHRDDDKNTLTIKVLRDASRSLGTRGA